jgi:hypothetical protein
MLPQLDAIDYILIKTRSSQEDNIFQLMLSIASVRLIMLLVVVFTLIDIAISNTTPVIPHHYPTINHFSNYILASTGRRTL